MSQKRRTRYLVIAVVVVALIVVGTLVVLSTRGPRFQTAEANQLLAEIRQETQVIAGSWNKISSDLENFRIVEITDDPSSWSAGIEYAAAAEADVTRIKNELDSIAPHYIKIDESLQALRNLQLPDWFSEYIGLMESTLQKDRERADKAQELLDNLSLFYAYSQEVLEGNIAERAMEKCLSDGTDKYDNGDYAGGREQFNKAKDWNSVIEAHAIAASELIEFAYLDRVKSNRIESEEVINKFLRVFDLFAAGSRDQAIQLLKDAEQQDQLLQTKRLHASDLMPEHRAWWSSQVDQILSEVRELTAEIEDLGRQIDALIEKNTS